MPKRCSVCNCSTLNVLTFRVTKKRIESWTSKTNKKLFIGDRVCQSHFPQEVLKTHVTSNLQNSSSSSRTILKEGATPLLLQSPTRLDDSVDEIMASPLQNSPDYLELKYSSSKLKQYTNKRVSTKIVVHQAKKNCQEPFSPVENTDNINIIFEQIYSDSKSINFPPNWQRITPANKKCVMFCNILFNEDSTPYFEKAVIIDEQATIKLFLYTSIQINIEKLGLTSNIILDLHEAEDIILTFSKATICAGTFIPTELLKYKPNTAWRIDNDEKFHHSKCLLINLPPSSHDNSLKNPTQTTKCNFCFSILDSIKKNKKRETNTRNCK